MKINSTDTSSFRPHLTKIFDLVWPSFILIFLIFAPFFASLSIFGCVLIYIYFANLFIFEIFCLNVIRMCIMFWQ